MQSIIFISTKSCGKCRALKAQIDKDVLPLIEFWDATEHEDFCKEQNITSVPALVVNGQVIRDYGSIVKFIKNL